MSQENVEIVWRLWAAYANGGVDAMAPYIADDCVLYDFAALPDRASYRGKEGMRGRYVQFVESWEDFFMEPMEVIDAGDDEVVAVVALRGRGKGGGVPLDGIAVFVLKLRGGEIIRDRAFTSRSEALKAVGLEE